MTAKDTIIEKILTDLPIASCRGEMTKEEWRGWFEEAFEKGEKYASQSKWVSVEDELPEPMEGISISKHVLAFIPVDEINGGSFKRTLYFDWNRERWFLSYDHQVVWNVTHWQPLPDKPVEK